MRSCARARARPLPSFSRLPLANPHAYLSHAPIYAERKSKLRQAQGDAKREIDEFKAQREARLRTVQPEAEALSAKVARLAGETDRKIAALEAEYQRNKEPVLQLIMQVVMSIDNPHAAAK